MYFNLLYLKLEKALRAFASSSGGAACPGGWGEGSTLGVGGDPKVILRRFKQKKIFVTDGRTYGRTDGQTDVIVEIVL